MPRVPDPDQSLADLGEDDSVDGPVRRWRQWWAGHDFDDRVVRASARQGFVLSTADQRDLGLSRAAVRWAVDSGHWTTVGRGVVAPIDVRRDWYATDGEHVVRRRFHALQAGAVIRARPGEAVSSRSAAVVHGLPTYSVPSVPDVNARRESGMGRRRTNHLLAGTLDAWEMTEWFGLPITSIARTLVDLGRLDRRDAIIAGDASLREEVVSRSDIDRSLGLATRWPGVVQAREVLALLDPRSESPLESLVRLRLHDDGFPPPELQYWIGRDRVDFYWPSRRVVLEADGRQKYVGDELWEEKKREQRLRSHGARVERVTWAEADRGWTRYSAYLRAVLS